jgi:hypothetical protein
MQGQSSEVKAFADVQTQLLKKHFGKHKPIFPTGSPSL